MKMTESLVHNLEAAMKMSELKKINSVRVILYWSSKHKNKR